MRNPIEVDLKLLTALTPVERDKQLCDFLVLALRGLKFGPADDSGIRKVALEDTAGGARLLSQVGQHFGMNVVRGIRQALATDLTAALRTDFLEEAANTYGKTLGDLDERIRIADKAVTAAVSPPAIEAEVANRLKQGFDSADRQVQERLKIEIAQLTTNRDQLTKEVAALKRKFEVGTLSPERIELLKALCNCLPNIGGYNNDVVDQVFRNEVTQTVSTALEQPRKFGKWTVQDFISLFSSLCTRSAQATDGISRREANLILNEALWVMENVSATQVPQLVKLIDDTSKVNGRPDVSVLMNSVRAVISPPDNK